MPQPRRHNSNAQRQAAYRRHCRERKDATLLSASLPTPPAIATIPAWRRWRHALELTENAVREVHEQMQTYHDDRSEAWQDSDKAEQFNDRMQAVEELLEQIAQCRDQIQ